MNKCVYTYRYVYTHEANLVARRLFGEYLTKNTSSSCRAPAMSVVTIVRIPEKDLKWLRILRVLGICLRVSVLQCVAVCCSVLQCVAGIRGYLWASAEEPLFQVASHMRIGLFRQVMVVAIVRIPGKNSKWLGILKSLGLWLRVAKFQVRVRSFVSLFSGSLLTNWYRSQSEAALRICRFLIYFLE